MPRIDPQQLLVCLTPLLASNGGIKSSAEVIRLASLMEKYSKKLVSKCTYIQILKCTKTELLGQFMSAGGWGLVHTWLKDGSESANWSFVQDILEVLLLCPVDGLRLKSNQTPKIVKTLSLNCSQSAVKILSHKLVEQWLKIAHQEKHQQLLVQNNSGAQQTANGLIDTKFNNNLNTVDDKNFLVNNNESVVKNELTELHSSENNNTTNLIGAADSDVLKMKSSENTVKYKISNKDTGLVLSIKRSTSPSIEEQDIKGLDSPGAKSSNFSSKSKSSSDKDKKKSGSSSSSSSSSHKTSRTSSHKDKERSSHRSSSSNKSSSKHSSSRDKDREKDKDKRKKDVEKKQAEKDKETLSFLTPASSIKMQRIPKRQLTESKCENKEESSSKAVKTSDAAVVEKKKPSISIEVRKGDKPKTVKTINSQFRNHGLAEDPPPPPSRKALNKKSANAIAPALSATASTISTSKLAITPTLNKKIEKALETEVPERVGGVKLIKPKPMLFESTGFLDALDATITTKKDPKKRKRVTSTSSSSCKRDDLESPKIEAKPMKFYNDTSEELAQEEKTNGSLSSSKGKESSPLLQGGSDANNEIASPKDEKSPKEEEEIDESEIKRGPGIGTGPDGAPGILVDPTVPRKKRQKRSIRWRPDNELTDIRLFELDENERCNVTKTFTEQKQMEHNLERNGFLMGRKLHSEDIMAEQMTWRPLKPIESGTEIKYGYKSREIEVQLEREKNTLQDLYLAGAMSNSAQEPDLENHEFIEPITIPPEDITGNPDAINDFRNVSWPPPKSDIPTFSSNAFSSIFNTKIPSALTANLTIPSIPLITNHTVNPLASLNIGGVMPNSPWQQGIIPTILPPAFLQAPPPPQIIPNNYQSANGFQSRNNYNSIGGNNNFSNNINNMDRNRVVGNNAASSNWIRGNSANNQMRKGTCFQYQKTGFCRKKNNGCPYIH